MLWTGGGDNIETLREEPSDFPKKPFDAHLLVMRKPLVMNYSRFHDLLISLSLNGRLSLGAAANTAVATNQIAEEPV